MTLNPMKSHVPVFLLMALAVTAAGCRQPDGALPTPKGEEVPNRLADLSRDLMAVGRGETQARQDFADDLRVFTKTPGGEKAAVEFGLSLGDAVLGAKVTEQSAQQLAHTSWTVVGATELSERQSQALVADVKSQLLALGVPEDKSAAAAAKVETVQKTISTRPRRWYEIF
jgi:hypothetical protein